MILSYYNYMYKRAHVAMSLKTFWTAYSALYRNYLLALIAKEFNVCKSRTELIKGLQGRDKCVAVHSPKTLPDWFLELTEKDPEDHGNF